jgi:hypothetical protein
MKSISPRSLFSVQWMLFWLQKQLYNEKVWTQTLKMKKWKNEKMQKC